MQQVSMLEAHFAQTFCIREGEVSMEEQVSWPPGYAAYMAS